MMFKKIMSFMLRMMNWNWADHHEHGPGQPQDPSPEDPPPEDEHVEAQHDQPVGQQPGQEGLAADRIVIISDTLSDLMPTAFSGNSSLMDPETFFTQFKTWLAFHPRRFRNDADRIYAIRYCLTSDALDWWLHTIQNPASVPRTLPDLERLFYAKYKKVKTRKS